MSIQRTPGWKCSDGTSKAELADAQERELVILLSETEVAKSDAEGAHSRSICKVLVENADKVVEILKTKERKKRKTNGKPTVRRARLPLAIKSDKPEVEVAK